MPELPPFVIRSVLGFVLGMALGFAGRRGRFCTLGAIEDAVYANDTGRLRAWLLAIAVAVAGVHALEAFGGLELSRSIYTGPELLWGGAIVGGLMFGVGMALAGTCSYGTLLRLGGGDLKALVTFVVMALVAMMTMRGAIAPVRVWITEPLSLQLPSASQRLPVLLGFDRSGAMAAALIAAAALAAVAFASASFSRSFRNVATGAAMGCLIVAGWWATGIAGFDLFETRRVESFTFVAPLGETVLYLMLSSGLYPDFPVGAVLGVIAGAFIASKSADEFRWEAPDDAREMRRHVLGAFLMGSGGIAALGCTIGQGITGISTLSLGSLLALASILVGARAGLYLMVER